MSTVLWANYLLDGNVVSDKTDHYALYKYTKKLDVICNKLGVEPLSQMLDFTDMKYNTSGDELPPGMTSTTEIMARDGNWVDAGKALNALDFLKAYLIEHYPRIGLLQNATPDIIDELEESIDWASKAESLSAKFNFSVVM